MIETANGAVREKTLEERLMVMFKTFSWEGLPEEVKRDIVLEREGKLTRKRDRCRVYVPVETPLGHFS